MEETKFDSLLRKAAEQTTRREALGALVGGALLLNERGEIEATKKAQRRKRRNSGPITRGFQITVDNIRGDESAVLQVGDVGDHNCCRTNSSVTIPRYQQRTFRTHRSMAWIWIDSGQKYWFAFSNFLGLAPFYTIGVRGRVAERHNFCCTMPIGDTVEAQWALDEMSGRYYDIEGRLFLMQRWRDSRDYKNYTISLPQDL